MTRQKLSAVLSAAVSAAGLAVIAAWILDSPFLKSFSPDFVTMKFSTALSFFLSGMILYLIALSVEGKRELAQVLLPPLVLTVLLIMTTLAASTVLNIESGIEELFMSSAEEEAVRTAVPGRPSIVTIMDFMLIAASGIATMFDSPRLRLWLLCAGWFITISGLVASAGYALGVPLLYYYAGGYLTAMAVHTAVLFVLSGAILLLASKEAEKGREHEH